MPDYRKQAIEQLKKNHEQSQLEANRRADVRASQAERFRAKLSQEPNPDPAKVRVVAERLRTLAEEYRARQTDPQTAETAGMTLVADAMAAGAFAGVERIAERAKLAARPRLITFVKLFEPEPRKRNLNIVGDWLDAAANIILAELGDDPDWVTVEDAARQLVDADVVDGLTIKDAKNRINKHRQSDKKPNARLRWDSTRFTPGRVHLADLQKLVLWYRDEENKKADGW